jgi:hypothetical protein
VWPARDDQLDYCHLARIAICPIICNTVPTAIEWPIGHQIECSADVDAMHGATRKRVPPAPLNITVHGANYSTRQTI